MRYATIFVGMAFPVLEIKLAFKNGQKILFRTMNYYSSCL